MTQALSRKVRIRTLTMFLVFFKTNIIAEDPKKMFTDSSFYNSKYHPTIADQVEMAHKLSSAMFNEQNKGTKGAKMYLTRMENSGEMLQCLKCLLSILNYVYSVKLD